jgi:hypothetical protein
MVRGAGIHMVMCRSSSSNITNEMGACGLPLRANKKECLLFVGFALVHWPLYFFSDDGIRTAHMVRYGLRIGDGFECVGGRCGDAVAYGRSSGGGCGVARERTRTGGIGGPGAAMDGWVFRTRVHSRPNVWWRALEGVVVQSDLGDGLGGVAFLSHFRGLFGGDWRMMGESSLVFL